MAKSRNKMKFMSKKIKNLINKIDVTIPGRIRSVRLKCGTPTCSCWEKKSKRHGPYFFWDRKVNNKLTSKSIPKEAIKDLKQWIENRKVLEELLRQMNEQGQIFACSFVEKKRG